MSRRNTLKITIDPEQTRISRAIPEAARVSPVLVLTNAVLSDLAAERGGGIGLLMRSMIATRDGAEAPQVYAAATRWVVEPVAGERTVQRWSVKLIHGHGGRVGETVILEHSRETNLVRAVKKLADRPMETGVRTGT